MSANFTAIRCLHCHFRTFVSTGLSNRHHNLRLWAQCVNITLLHNRDCLRLATLTADATAGSENHNISAQTVRIVLEILPEWSLYSPVPDRGLFFQDQAHFIVTGPWCTRTLIMLFNQRLDMPHLSDRWIILAKECSLMWIDTNLCSKF